MFRYCYEHEDFLVIFLVLLSPVEESVLLIFIFLYLPMLNR